MPLLRSEETRSLQNLVELAILKYQIIIDP